MQRFLQSKFFITALSLIAILVLIDFLEGPRLERIMDHIAVLRAAKSAAFGRSGDNASGTPRILFIGNSLTGYHDMPGEVAAIAELNGRHPYIEKHLNYGKDLKFQLAQADIVEALKTKKWDFVVLQEYSNYPTENVGQFSENVLAFVPLIEAAGAKTVLFENWPYRGAAPTAIRQIDAAYATVAEQAGAAIVHVGDVHDRIVHHSSINMYMDEKHPTPIATYVAASEFVDYFFKIPAAQNLPHGAKLPSKFELDPQDLEALKGAR